VSSADILKNTENYVRQLMLNDCSGHDWWHVWRVRKLALKIAQTENAEPFIVEMAALLHDLDDHKLEGSGNRVEAWLNNKKIAEEHRQKILFITRNISYKGAAVDETPLSIEGQCVRDADRIDAMGAIGIARTFAYGGSRQRPIYDPDIKPEMHSCFENYKASTAPTLNHFYEKLLLLKDRLHTAEGKRIGDIRHRRMENFLHDFFEEWDYDSVRESNIQ
jgi:uncharacterized protein